MPLYNSAPAAAGGSALDANGNLVLPNPTAVTTPATGAIAERVITKAGFSQLGYANVDIPDLSVMPGLESSSVYKMEAQGVSSSTLVTACTANPSGTVSGITPTFTSYTTSKNLIQTSTGATAGTFAGLAAIGAFRYRGNGAKRGGFYVVIRFVPVLQVGHQGSVGLANSNTFSAEPSAESGAILGMIADSTDTNWQMFSKAATGTGTKIDTGLSKTLTGSLLALYLYAAPGGTGVVYQLDNEEAGTTVASGTMTATLPAGNVSFNATAARVRNGSTTTAALMQLAMLYNSSRYS